MAFALARSFRRWNRNSGIEFHLATDAEPEAIPSDLKDIALIPLSRNQYGSGFETKLHLDKIAPADRNLFIDADCLCVGPLAGVFDSFAGHDVSVIGRNIDDGEWFGDVANRCKRFSLPSVPRFNGGIYYLERGERSGGVYDTARSLAPLYDDIGLVRLRGQKNDEVVISLAMALNRQTAIPECGDIMNTLIDGNGGLQIDVFRGKALIENRKGRPRYNDWIKVEELRPRVVHFLGVDTSYYPYNREIARLALADQFGWPGWLARIWVMLIVSLPSLAEIWIKRAFRPLLHAVAGPRKVRPTSRTN